MNFFKKRKNMIVIIMMMIVKYEPTSDKYAWKLYLIGG